MRACVLQRARTLVNELGCLCGYMNAAGSRARSGVRAGLAIMCIRACTVVACVRKQRQTPSVSLSASCSVIDVDGNAQTAAEELLTHERQTR